MASIQLHHLSCSKDACRNNPYVARRGARGLAAMVAGSDSLIAFSAAAGQTAEDGDGDNSPYAAALAAEMRRPGLTFAQVFQNVRKRLLERQRHRPADERQTPTEVSQLTRDHYFVPPSGAPVRTPETVQPADWAREEWEQIKRTSSAEALEAFNGRHRDSRYADFAKLWLDELRRSVAGFGQKTAPVGSYAPNAFGIHDVHGNVSEFVEDCWNQSYEGAPIDGRAWLAGDCERRVRRGDGYNGLPQYYGGWGRYWRETSERGDAALGFRVARTLTP